MKTRFQTIMKNMVQDRITFLIPAAWVIGALPLCAAPNDELIGEQVAFDNLTRETEKSFWDPSFWRSLTHPLEIPIVPTETHYLNFGVKKPDGVPLFLPAVNLRLYTAARLGFTPPPVTPSFTGMYFGFRGGDKIVFDGKPNTPADPFGRLVVAGAEWLEVLSGSEIEFDRTVVQADNTRVWGGSITFSGDVASSNFRSLGNIDISRNGSQTIPSLKLRAGAIAELASLNYSFVPAVAPATSNTAVAIESGGNLQATNVALTHAGGKVFDASAGRGRATFGLVNVTGNAPETDPAVIFHAAGENTPASAFTVTDPTILRGFRGVLAQIEDGATMNFQSYISNLSNDGKMGLRANRAGTITMNEVFSNYSSDFGSTQLDWVATTNGRITLNQRTLFPLILNLPLHLNPEAHVISALSGGKIDIPNSLGIDPGGRLLFSASGAGSELLLKPVSEFAPQNYSTALADRWSHLDINLTDGAILRGGETTEHGVGEYVADVRQVSIQNTAMASDLRVIGASMKNVSLSFQDAAVRCEIGSVASPAVLNQVSLSLGDGSLLMMRGSSWQPERVEMIGISQSLQLGNIRGGSIGTITDGSLVHEVDLQVGPSGGPSLPGEPPSVAANSFLTISGGSTVTGTLGAAQYAGGRGTITISGTTTNCGFRNVQLGVASFPNIGMPPGPLGPIRPPVFAGEFFSNLGGQSELNVTSSARLAIGGYLGAHGEWQVPDPVSPAFLAANATPITIDGTSAIYLGAAANVAEQDFRPGALVVGPGGYMIGTGTVSGAAAGGNDLVNAGGTISPGFSPGSMTVDGNFLMESGTLVLEVKSGSPGEWDAIIADAITINGGTIIIRPAANYDSGAGIAVDFFQTTNLTIAPGVTIQIAPELGTAVFNAATGMISIVGGSELDLNHNLIDDRIEAVLPATPSGVEWPQLQQALGNPPVLVFRRKDSSLFSHNLTVQWSGDLTQWTDISVPFDSLDEVIITQNDADPDLIEVTLPNPPGPNPKIFVRLAVSENESAP
jgi:hypothetical protein